MQEATRTIANGRFSITRPLQAGGMAEVFEAYDHVLGVWRAVKFLHPQLAARKGILRRFNAEAHAMARLEHPHVVRIYDVGDDDGVPYLVMELANGGSIQGYLERYGTMDPLLAVDALIQICDGVQAAHDEGIIHRDLKPGNILVDSRGTCKVADFGIAQLEETDIRTKTGSVMGTLAYMAPEQRADSKQVGVTADVYGLGATLFSMLCGEVPMELFMAGHHPDMLESIPEPLRPVILDAVRYSPSARTPTAAALADALRQARPALRSTDEAPPPLVLKTTDPRPVPTQSRPPVTDANDETIFKGDEVTPPTPAGRNAPDTLEPSEVAALIPDLMKELEATLQSDDQVVEKARQAEIRKAAALKRLDALKAKKVVTLSETPEPPAPTSEAPRERPATATSPEPEVNPTKRVKTSTGGGPWEILMGAVDLAVRMLSGPLKPVAIASVVLMGPILLVLGLGARAVHQGAVEAKEARAALVVAVQSEKRVLDEIDALGGVSHHARLHLQRVKSLDGEAQIDAATAFVNATAGQVYKHAKYAPSEVQDKARSAQGRLKGLEEAMERYDAAQKAWEDAASKSGGAVACAVGVVDCPW